MRKRVVITGAGILSDMGRGLEATAVALLRKESPISKINTFDSSVYASSFGGVIRDEDIDNANENYSGKTLDRSTHMLYTVCKDALSSAGLGNSALRTRDIPIFLGTTLGGTLSGQIYHREYLTSNNEGKRFDLLEDYLACSQIAHISSIFDLAGETIIINNACASGVNAIGLAFRRITGGREEIAISGGYDVMSEFTYAGFNSLQLLTNGKCRPFDKNRSGLILGEGAGVLVLEEMGHAQRRGAKILSEVIGFGQSTDAYHITKPDPEARGAAMAIEMAMQTSGVKASDIDYVNAHGTGTRANDLMEARAIVRAMGDYGKKVPISSTKPITGHLLGAAGAVEAIISLICIEKKILPVTLNCEEIDPDCELNVIIQEQKTKKLKTVLSTSFGFGGSNGAIILREINEK